MMPKEIPRMDFQSLRQELALTPPTPQIPHAQPESTFTSLPPVDLQPVIPDSMPSIIVQPIDWEKQCVKNIYPGTDPEIRQAMNGVLLESMQQLTGSGYSEEEMIQHLRGDVGSAVRVAAGIGDEDMLIRAVTAAIDAKSQYPVDTDLWKNVDPHEFSGRMYAHDPVVKRVAEGRKFPLLSRSIYDAGTLAEIRNWADGKRIVIVDCHGLLLDNEGNPNPKAQDTLRVLRRAGYTLVLWTYGSDQTIRDLASVGLYPNFDLLISHDNYHLYPKEVFSAFIEATPWLPENYRAQPVQLYGRKNPFLFKQAVMLDDDPHHYPDLSTSPQYRFIRVTPFDAPGIVAAYRSITKQSVPFDPQIVDAVDRAFVYA